MIPQSRQSSMAPFLRWPMCISVPSGLIRAALSRCRALWDILCAASRKMALRGAGQGRVWEFALRSRRGLRGPVAGGHARL
jgi:hypothetical protein